MSVQEMIASVRASGAIKLSLHGMGLDTIPEEVADLTQLQVLNVSQNRLVEIPDFVGQLTNLREFAAPMNQIAEFPVVICELPEIQVIELSLNKISDLPPLIGRAYSLRHLGMAMNKLQALPVELADILGSLRSLNVSANQLTAILPEVLGVWLEEPFDLRVAGNPLANVPPDLESDSAILSYLADQL
ncbi:MAG: hypothetical protein L0154_06915 [Chloroflexi bacterium]|nr:hypothetical protein [Chloroflexota bacterium]